jgi:anti-sigma factor RsiW
LLDWHRDVAIVLCPAKNGVAFGEPEERRVKMKTEEMLRLQAYLDNEVSSSEARQIASWITRDSEAKALYEELACTKSLLTPDNEPAVVCPDSRDFYWSKIAREIERADREPLREVKRAPWWIRILAPIAGTAALAVFVFTSISFNAPQGHMAQVEQSQTDSSITFYSPEQKMTVVWIPSGRAEADANVQQDEEALPADQPAPQGEAF